MLKTILLVIAIVLAYWFFLGSHRARRNDTGSSASDRSAQPPESMVICAYCGLHVPESECIVAAGRHYCSDEHRRLGAP